MSEVTKKYKRQRSLYGGLHIFLPIIASVGFLVTGFLWGTKETTTKLIAAMALAAVLLLINVLRKVKLTCIPYVLLVALVNINTARVMPIIYGMTVYTILDDFWFRGKFLQACSKYNASRVTDEQFTERMA